MFSWRAIYFYLAVCCPTVYLPALSLFSLDKIHSALTEKGYPREQRKTFVKRNLHLSYEIQVLSGQGAHTRTRRLEGNTRAQTLQSPKHHILLTHHTGSKFQELFLGLWDSFNSDQVALLVVRGNAHRHLVQILNPVNFKARTVVTQSARQRLGSKAP